MRKILMSALLLVSAGAAYAADYGSAGCGVGSLLFKENDQTQILAGTTNGFFGQSWSMTSGTSNCNNKGFIKLGMERRSYIEANYKDLSRDVARGNGEYVTNLARLYGYTPENTWQFTQLLQKNHTTIFASNSAQTAVTTIDKLVSNL